jgi:hypothetical protein
VSGKASTQATRGAASATKADAARVTLQRKCACGAHTVGGAECDSCAKEKSKARLQRAAVRNKPAAEASNAFGVPAAAREVLSSAGRPLDSSTRSLMESRFGHDFSRVRVHADGDAARAALSVGARAYTVGRDVVFGAGEYAPKTEAGRKLLTHELTHVVQQSAVTSAPGEVTLGEADDRYEREADANANSAARATAAAVGAVASPVTVASPVAQRATRPALMRAKLFSSTVEMCHNVLESRRFKVSQGGLRVSSDTRWIGPTEGAASCETHHLTPYDVWLTQKDYVFDNNYGSCPFYANRVTSRAWTGLPPDEYYLTLGTGNTNPNCCLTGTIDVYEDKGLKGPSCAQPSSVADDVLELLHDVLDAAGLVPVLGAVPDGVNAGIYAIEGDWVNAGISVAAMIPIFGEGVTITKAGLKVTDKAVKKLGKEALEAELKALKAEAKFAKAAEKKLVKEGLEKGEKKAAEGGAKKVVVKGAESALERAARYAAEGTIITYKEGKEITSGLNHAYEAHHILEARHIKNWFKDYGEKAVKTALDEAPSVILSKKDHQLMGNLLTQELPTGVAYSKEAVLKAYRKVYAKFPKYLKAIEHYFAE